MNRKASITGKRLFPTALTLALLSACGGGSDGDKTNNGANGVNGDENTASALFTDVVGRSVTTIALRATHILRQFQPWLDAPETAPINADTKSCDQSGSKQYSVVNQDGVLGTGDSVTISYQQCAESTAVGSQTLTGDLTFSFNGDNVAVTTNSLNITGPGTNSIEITNLNATTVHNSNPAETTLTFTANFPTLNINGVNATTAETIKAENISCPSAGILLLTASDNSESKITFSPGENMLVAISGAGPFTLNCSELIQITIEPPTAPGGNDGSDDGDGGDNDDSSSGGGSITPPPPPG